MGRGLLVAAPWLMKALAVVGTAAMFLVGGGILVHGLGPVHHAVDALVAQLAGAGGLVQGLVPLLADALVGVVAGALVLRVCCWCRSCAPILSKKCLGPRWNLRRQLLKA